MWASNSNGDAYWSGGRPQQPTDPRPHDVKEMWDEVDKQLVPGKAVEVKNSDDGSTRIIYRLEDGNDLIVECAHGD